MRATGQLGVHILAPWLAQPARTGRRSGVPPARKRSTPSRKRRAAGARVSPRPTDSAGAADAPRTVTGGSRAGARAQGSPSRKPSQASSDGRPQAPWHPLPLSEMLILAGAAGFLIGLVRGPTASGLIAASVAAVALGTLEVTLREHLSGFRSHTVLLALLPAVVVHTVAVLVAGRFTHVGRTLNLVLIAVDVAIVVTLFRLLRARYGRARLRRRSSLRRS